MKDLFETIDDVYEQLSKDGHLFSDGGVNYKSWAYIKDRLREIAGRYLQDKLVRRYMNLALLCEGVGVKVTEPWRALAEQRFQILSIAHDHYPFAVYGMPDLDEEKLTRMRIQLVSTLMVSQTFMWRSEVLDQLKDYPMSECVVSKELMSFPYMYHTFENALSVNENSLPTEIDVPDLCIDWVQFCHRPKQGIEITHNMGGNNPSKFFVYTSMFGYGEKYPGDASDIDKKAKGFILSLFAFLKSPYIDISKEILPRHIRRGDNLDKETCSKEISVVSLRKDVRDRIASYNSESKEWKHKWWVRGHYRNQWYPSTKTHEVVWVAPYIKGKEDLPMIEKVYDVNR